MSMDLYINSYGTYLHKVGEMFELEAELDGKKIKQKMKLLTRIAVTTVLATGFSMAAQAADVNAAPAPAQDPIVQHLKLPTIR